MLRRLVSVVCLAPALLLIACSSNDSSPSSGSGGAGDGGSNAGNGGGTAGGANTGGGTPWNPGGKVTSYHAQIEGVHVATGGENTQCITFRLDNETPAYVRRFNTMLATGSHHMILYKSSATTENKTPTDCPSLGGIFEGDHPVFIAQQRLSELELPTDEDAKLPVALLLEPHQMVKLELHYFNTTGGPLTVGGDIQVDTISTTTKVTETDLAFWGTRDIDIPAHGQFDTGVHFQYGIPNTKSFAVTTHQHHLGTEMRVWFGTGASAAKATPLADSHSWSDPPLVLLTPPVSFAPATTEGGLSPQGFAYQCHWENTTSNEVKFGESVNDEMCFLWQYYYPSQGFQACFDGLCNFTK